MKKLFLTSLALALVLALFSQNIAISDDNSYTADPSAMLDIKSLTKGFLTPRMTTVQRDAITLPAIGLLVFDTNINGYYYYNGTDWVNLSTGGTTGPFWSYNSPNIYMTTGTNKLGLGISNPYHKLHLYENVAIIDGTDGNFIDIQNSNSSTGAMCGIRFTNGTGWNPDAFKCGIFYRDVSNGNRGDLIFANNSTYSADHVNSTDARLVLQNDGRVMVKGDPNSGLNDAIFAVQNTDGDTVFAVYPEGVRIWVNDDGGAKANGSRGGFAVGGFNPAKAGFTNEYLRVTPDSVRVYIDDDYNPAKANGSRGGFAVGGFNPAKGTATDHYLFVQDDSTRVYVADSMEGFGVENIEAIANQRISRLNTENYFIGHESGVNITNGKYNSFYGYKAGMNTTGGVLVVDFPNDFQDEWEGSNNIFIGSMSGYENTIGHENVFVGKLSGISNTSGVYNTYVGYQSGGYSDGTLSTGSFNVFMGCKSGVNNIDGTHNVFLGNCSGWENTGGTGNSFLGSNSGFHCTTGDYNVFLGNRSGFNNYTGYNNTYIGYHSGEFSTGGSNNVFIGYYAGQNESGSDKLYIENSNSATPLIYGDFNTDYITINGDLHANGTFFHVSQNPGVLATPEYYSYQGGSVGSTTKQYAFAIHDALWVTREAWFDDDITCVILTQTSDKRYKTNIQSIDNSLDKIMKMQGVYYEWKKEDFPHMGFDKGRNIGFIAQDVQKVFPELVKSDNNGYLSVNYANFTAVLLEAIKEQNNKIEILEQKIEGIDSLKAEVDQLKTILETTTNK